MSLKKVIRGYEPPENPTHNQILDYLDELERFVESSFPQDKQDITRYQIVRDNPKIFHTLYANYKMPEDRKHLINETAEACADAVYNNPKIREKINNWNSLGLEERVNTLDDISDYLARFSGIQHFKTPLGNLIGRVKCEDLEENNMGNFKDKANENDIPGLFTFNRQGDISMNSEMLSDNKRFDESMNTYFHEYWHFNQKCIESNKMMDLNHKFYFSYDKDKIPEGLTKEEAYATYKSQPMEKESWSFGEQMPEKLQSRFGQYKRDNFIYLVQTIAKSNNEEYEVNNIANQDSFIKIADKDGQIEKLINGLNTNIEINRDKEDDRLELKLPLVLNNNHKKLDYDNMAHNLKFSYMLDEVAKSAEFCGASISKGHHNNFRPSFSVPSHLQHQEYVISGYGMNNFAKICKNAGLETKLSVHKDRYLLELPNNPKLDDVIGLKNSLKSQTKDKEPISKDNSKGLIKLIEINSIDK